MKFSFTQTIAIWLSLFVSVSAWANSEQVTTSTGAVFQHVTNHGSLGEAWCDSSHLCWSDLLTENNDVVSFAHDDAQKECQKRFKNARLPKQNEMERFLMALGKGAPASYKPQLLPRVIKNDQLQRRQWVWTLETDPEDSNYSHDYGLHDGGKYYSHVAFFSYALCVADQ